MHIVELLNSRVSQSPDKSFIFSEADGRSYTYLQFAQGVNRLAALLSNKGIKKGDVVSLLLPNSVEYVIAYFACWQLGALAGPINSLLKEHEMTYVISDSETRALLVHNEFLPIIEK